MGTEVHQCAGRSSGVLHPVFIRSRSACLLLLQLTHYRARPLGRSKVTRLFLPTCVAYWKGVEPRPTTPLPPRGESMEVQVPACLCNWPCSQCQVPVLWLASQHGSSPHLKHSHEEKFNTFILSSDSVSTSRLFPFSITHQQSNKPNIC